MNQALKHEGTEQLSPTFRAGLPTGETSYAQTAELITLLKDPFQSRHFIIAGETQV